jgi:hypothetical protein
MESLRSASKRWEQTLIYRCAWLTQNLYFPGVTARRQLAVRMALLLYTMKMSHGLSYLRFFSDPSSVLRARSASVSSATDKFEVIGVRCISHSTGGDFNKFLIPSSLYTYGRWESCVARSFGRYSEWIIVLATSWLLKDAIIRSVDVRSLGDSGESKCPTTGEVLGRRCCPPSPKELHEALDKTREAYRYIRDVPAPKRGVTRPPANNGPHSQQYSEMSLVPLFLWR